MNPAKLCTHKELAAAYFPEIHPRLASRRLSNWINNDEELLAELSAAGYVKRQRIYTPRQMEILFDHVGEPEWEES